MENENSLRFTLAKGAIAGILVGVVYGFNSCDSNNPQKNYDEDKCQVHTFDIGEHIVTIPIANPLKNIQTYDYHAGYKAVGISSAGGESCLLYVNDRVVEMNSNGSYETGELFYGGFGYPVDGYIINEPETKTEYAPGEHIISEPISDPRHYEMQYKGHEGYEVVGIASAASGKYNFFEGACLLYVNTETVICENDNEFGQVKEEQKVLTKNLQ